MDLQRAREKAEAIAQLYNPDGLSPFPFEKISNAVNDLIISETDKLPDEVSGAITFAEEENKFIVLLNKNHSQNRKYFTTAHEIGHYYLHSEKVKQAQIFIDLTGSLEMPALFRAGRAHGTEEEIEANNFAASLIMPAKLVTEAWDELKDIQKCAAIFNVSVSAMSIRLEKLGLVS